MFPLGAVSVNEILNNIFFVRCERKSLSVTFERCETERLLINERASQLCLHLTSKQTREESLRKNNNNNKNNNKRLAQDSNPSPL